MMDKRKPVLARKGAPTVVIALGGPKLGGPSMKEEKGLTCPKCGMELADTPENREYAATREKEKMDDDYEDKD